MTTLSQRYTNEDYQMNYAYEPKDIRAQNMAAGIDREQSPRLMLKLATLEKSVHQLRDSLGQLGEKLIPITLPSQPLPAQETMRGGATISSSPVVAQIENIESLIWDLNARVRHQIEEMDL